MLKRNLLNLILFVFILVLVMLVVYEPGKEVAITPPTLTNLKINDIKYIKINRKNTEIEFKKINSEWVMLKPYRIVANSFRLESILKLASAVSLSQNSINDLELSSFGLENPRARVTFNKTVINFGHNKSLKHLRYIKIDSVMHMIADTFYYQLTAKADSFISHKLIPGNNKITKLILPSLKLENIDGKWEVNPKADNFSADSVTQLINEWQLSQAIDVEKVNLTKTGKPDITIQLNNKKEYNFTISKNENDFKLTNTTLGVRYTLTTDRENKLLQLLGIDQNDSQYK